MLGAFLGGSSGKEPATNAGDIRDVSSVPGLVDPLEEGMTTHSSILAWRILWTEGPGGLRPRGCKESDMAEAI